MSSDDVRATGTEVRLLRALDDMAAPVRIALTRWLWDHDITPSEVALGLAIERDDVQHVLVWRERRPGGQVVKRWRFAPYDDGTRWPAPFPDVVLGADAGLPAELSDSRSS